MATAILKTRVQPGRNCKKITTYCEDEEDEQVLDEEELPNFIEYYKINRNKLRHPKPEYFDGKEIVYMVWVCDIIYGWIPKIGSTYNFINRLKQLVNKHSRSIPSIELPKRIKQIAGSHSFVIQSIYSFDEKGIKRYDKVEKEIHESLKEQKLRYGKSREYYQTDDESVKIVHEHFHRICKLYKGELIYQNLSKYQNFKTISTLKQIIF